MRKSTILFIGVMAFLTATPVFSQDFTRLEISPTVQIGFGETEYEMDITFDNNGSLERVKSLLEFPLSTTNLGLNASIINGTPDIRTLWKVDLTLLTNMIDPTGTMYDHDWEAIDSEPLQKFSYTESNSELKSYVLELSAARNIRPGKSSNILFLIGFTYEHYDYDIIDYSGWQIRNNVRHNFSSNEDAIKYKVDYYFPYGGIEFLLGHPYNNLSAGVKLGVGPVFYSDFDDHLLRFKEADASGTGIGILAGLDIRKYLGDARNVKRPYIGIEGDLRYYNTTGDQTQTWYGDDPASEDYDDTGDSITNIPHDVRSLSYRIGVKLGISF